MQALIFFGVVIFAICVLNEPSVKEKIKNIEE